MIALLRRYLRPYLHQLLLVAGLLLLQSVANLYLPELNAEIINTGVVRGDTDYILRTGGLMVLMKAGCRLLRMPQLGGDDAGMDDAARHGEQPYQQHIGSDSAKAAMAGHVQAIRRGRMQTGEGYGSPARHG